MSVITKLLSSPRRFSILFAAAPLALFACASANDAPTAESSAEALSSCGTTVPVDPTKSLFVVDSALQAFTLEDVLNQIVATGSTTNTQNALGVYQQLLDTLNNKAKGVTSGPHCDDDGGTINGFPIECPRQEGLLASTNPFVCRPGLLRPDRHRESIRSRSRRTARTAANTGSSSARTPARPTSSETARSSSSKPCCPIRIRAPASAPAHPSRNSGIRFPPTRIASSRAKKLHNFYFKGLPGFSPVIDAHHYGIESSKNTGQIRGNLIHVPIAAPGQEWELREWKLSQNCVGGPLHAHREQHARSSESFRWALRREATRHRFRFPSGVPEAGAEARRDQREQDHDDARPEHERRRER